jgi:uncharacterized membrane protein YphA (DoxX/SURF4 family)
MNILTKILGAFFVIFGITKIIPIFGFGYGFAGTAGFVAMLGYPFAAALVVAAIVLEIALGLTLLLRPTDSKEVKYASYGLLAFTLIATLMFHIPLVGGEVITNEMTAILKNAVVAAALWAIGKNIS